MPNESRTLSFSASVKEEICSLERSDEEKRSLLSAFIKINGHLSIGSSPILELSSESAFITKCIYKCIKDVYGISTRFSYTRSAGFLKRIAYHVILDTEPMDVLNDLEIDLLSGKLPKNSQATQELGAAYIAGAFLAAGSVNDPKSSNYHLEIAVNDAQYAKWLSRLINKMNGGTFTSKVIERRKKNVIYIKRSDEISDFLIMIGAKQSCLEFENVRIMRDFSNIGNRLTNLDTANMGKTIKASDRQIEQINFLVDKYGWDYFEGMNPKLYELMKLRIEYRDESLNELSIKLSEALNTEISRSNVNHLLRWIDAKYREEQGDGH